MNLERGASLVTILTGLIAAIWFVASLDRRIATLEAQMQAVTITSSVRLSSPNSTTTAPPQESGPQTSTQVVQVNPIAQTCADLAKQMAEKYKSASGVSALEPLDLIMSRLGCGKFAK
jgi:hypoxanthine-guanine phosphoribosyltransferase